MDDKASKANLSNDERKLLNQKRITLQVSPFEAEVIKELRTFTHGRFIIHVLDGIPVRYSTEVNKMFFEGADPEQLGIAASTSRNPYQR